MPEPRKAFVAGSTSTGLPTDLLQTQKPSHPLSHSPKTATNPGAAMGAPSTQSESTQAAPRTYQRPSRTEGSAWNRCRSGCPSWGPWNGPRKEKIAYPDPAAES